MEDVSKILKGQNLDQDIRDLDHGIRLLNQHIRDLNQSIAPGILALDLTKLHLIIKPIIHLLPMLH